MLIKSNLKKAVLGFTVGILLAMSTSAVFAVSASSPYKPYTIYGKDYQSVAIVASYNNDAVAYTTIYASSNVPAGYMGAMPRLYNDSGSLCASKDWEYNATSTSAISTVTLPIYTSDGYYSYGRCAAYNGNGYTYGYTYQSPCINI